MGEVVEMNRSLGEWTENLRARGFVGLAFQLHEDKIATTERLQEFGLPHFQTASGPTSDFLRNPSTFFNDLRTKTFYASVNSTDAYEQRVRTFGLDREGIIKFVESVIQEHGPQYDSLLLMETGAIQYGANIIISPNYPSDIYAEIVQGTHADLVGSQQPVLLTMHRDPEREFIRFANLHPKRYDKPKQSVVLKYDEIAVRSTIIAALRSIPHHAFDDHGQGFDLRGAIFHPGYYEVVLIGDVNQSLFLQPKFIEYSNQPPFMLARQNEKEVETYIISILREKARLRDQAA